MYKLLGANNYLVVNKIVAKEVGIEASVLLSHLVYKSDFFKDNQACVIVGDEHYFYCTADDIEEATCLTYARQKPCIAILEEIGFIKVRRMGIPAKLHFMIDEDKISSFLKSRFEENADLYNSKYKRTYKHNYKSKCKAKKSDWEEEPKDEQKDIPRDQKLFPDSIHDFSPSNTSGGTQVYPEGDNAKNSPRITQKTGVSSPTWRTDFEVYKKELKEAVRDLLSDREFVAEREKFYPNIDLPLTLEKAVVDFWGKPEGWKNKKRSKTVNIDWRSTFIYAIDRARVYKPRVFGAPQEPVASPTRQKINL